MSSIDAIENVIIIGSGVAGLTASIYLSRANLNPILLEGDSSSNNLVPGGLILQTNSIENFPGFLSVDGFQLIDNMKQQSLKYGTRILSETAINIECDDDFFMIRTNDNTYKSKSIIMATGSSPKHIECNNYSLFWQKGISTCAICDGALFKNQPVCVVGGGDSAMEESLFLTNTSPIVYLIHRRDAFRASKIMIDRVLANSKIKIIWNSELDEVCGDNTVESVIIRSNVNNSKSKLTVNGVFVAIGHSCNSALVKQLVHCDEDGYIITNNTQTNLPGLFACGDCQDRKYKQAVTACGSGCIAALECEKYLRNK